LETGRKSNLGPADLIDQLEIENKVNHKHIVLDFDLFIPTFKRQLLSLSLHGRQLISSEKRIPISDLFRLGGTKSLRGYREDQFRGSIISWINAEYRYIMGRRSRAFTFVDVGYYENNYMNSAHAVKIGYGFGVRLETGLGIMGIDYGLAYGEKMGVMSGLLHVGLVNEF
jgi:outer membrane translocation and assembly module TamA